MYVYSPEKIIPSRIAEAEKILAVLPVKHAFITGSFLYKQKYNDIDVFVLTRSKKTFSHPDKRVDLHVVHPNRASSLFYHSATKLCVATSVLPRPKLRTTLSGYWETLNWALTPVYGVLDLDKELRRAVVATSYHADGRLLDSAELARFHFREYETFERYIFKNAPVAFRKMRPSYLRRFFAGLATHYAEAVPAIPALIRMIA